VILRSLLVDAALALRARRMQAALSAFGIATGIAAVVLLVSLVSGLHRMALRTFNTRGGNVVVVSVGTDPSAAPTSPPLTLSAEDAEAVIRASPYFDRASPENGASAVVRGVTAPGLTVMMVGGPGGVPVRVNGPRAYQIQITGLSAHGFEMQNVGLSSGRLPAPAEFESGARVVVLGARVADQIFGEKTRVGETVVLADWPFTVIGVARWVGEPSGEFQAPQDRAVYAPFETVATLFKGNDTVNRIALRLAARGSDDRAVADARGILMRRLQRLGQTSGQLEFTNASDQLRELGLVLSGLKLLVGLVGGIGLFVGAVGVANVLLVSVRERTAEIGIRRAVGARRRHIFLGFLFESLAITLAGGAVGIVVAWMLTRVARLLPIPDGAEPYISLVTAAGAVSLLVLVGLIAGVGPARRAAAVYPVEALRAE
jgi:ABC-type antimicrobial peptide transport system permease subunit